eukprot:6223098-Prorocentrum_lima.AAC.1
MAALLLKKLVGIWQTTRDGERGTAVLTEAADPAHAVETVLLKACRGQPSSPDSPAPVQDAGAALPELAATP